MGRKEENTHLRKRLKEFEDRAENFRVQELRKREDDIRFFRPSRSCAYEGWTVAELKKRARQLGISGYSSLNKERLIALIRSY